MRSHKKDKLTPSNAQSLPAFLVLPTTACIFSAAAAGTCNPSVPSSGMATRGAPYQANCNQAPRARANPFPQGSGLLWLDETRRQQADQPFISSFISSVLTCLVHAPKLLNERLLPQKPGGAISQQNSLHPFTVTPASLASLSALLREKTTKQTRSKHAVNTRAGPCRPHALRWEGAWGGKAAFVPPRNPALAAFTCQGKVTCLYTWEDICGSFYLSYNVSKLNFWLTARQTNE